MASFCREILYSRAEFPLYCISFAEVSIYASLFPSLLACVCAAVLLSTYFSYLNRYGRSGDSLNIAMLQHTFFRLFRVGESNSQLPNALSLIIHIEWASYLPTRWSPLADPLK